MGRLLADPLYKRLELMASRNTDGEDWMDQQATFYYADPSIKSPAYFLSPPPHDAYINATQGESPQPIK